MLTFDRTISAGQLVTWSLLALAAYGNWVTYGIEQRRLREDHSTLVERVSRIDNEGTRKSQAGIQAEQYALESTMGRLKDLETDRREFRDKLEAMDKKLEVLMSRGK